MRHRSTPILAGVVAAVVGFSSAFVVVLAGLAAVGASPSEAESGLIAVTATGAIGMIWLAVRHRAPIALAWSTPGAALLLSTGTVSGGWSAAVGAFVVTGVLIGLTGLIPALGDLIARIPTALARAMLAGVLVPICLEPVVGLADSPAYVGPVVATWLAMHLISRRWATPAALAVALIVVIVAAGDTVAAGDLAPSLRWTTPTWTVASLVGIAVPLYVVTMASQNVPGLAIISSYGFRVPWRESMGVTGAGTVIGAPLGGHAINLAAITAAMTAGPDGGEDRDRRWLATLSAGVTYLVLAVIAGALAALVEAAPEGVMQAAAGLALLGTLAASLGEALADADEREAAAVCFVVAASGITVVGVGAAFWALVAGLVLRPLLGPGVRRPSG